MAHKNDNKNYTVEEVSDFSLSEFFLFCLRHWVWFLVCMAFSVGIALFYIYKKQPEYLRYEQILVNSQDTGTGVGDITNSFSSLGLFSKNSNVYNELLTITSPAILYEVADSLQLDMNYSLRDGLRMKTLYGKNLPFRIDMLDLDKQDEGSFRLKYDPGEGFTAYKFVRNLPEGKIKYKEVVKFKEGDETFDSPLGKIKITPNASYKPLIHPKAKEIHISKMAMQSTVELYGLNLKGDLADEDADVIELSIEDVSVQRAVDILQYILIVYNRNWLYDKNRMASATSKFIDERLAVIQSELGSVDKTIAGYMKETGTPDLLESARMNMERGTAMEKQLVNLNNELSVAMYMKEFLKDNNNITTVIPANLGLNSPDLSNRIMAYNELLMSRENIVNNSSVNNPLVENYDRQLAQMREAIVLSVDNGIKNIETSISNYKKELGTVNSINANTPEANLPLLSEERQRTIKQNLYLFLLQKREENELTRKFSADNIRVITPPVGPLKPVSPRKALIIITSLIIGIGVPLILLYYLESTDTKIHSRKDINSLKAPFAGEIPFVGKKASANIAGRLFNKLKKNSKDEMPLSVVAEGKRDVVNEAFRVVRGNIEFMSANNSPTQVIMLTSINPGSGKSFISYNLALSYAIKNKRVLLIDCDLRHGSSSMYVGNPPKGLTNYLTGTVSDWNSLVLESPVNKYLNILPIGKMPPNPTELLENNKLEDLLKEAEKKYDLIVLDAPPVNIVADTQIIAKWVDKTLFVIRAGLLERSALGEINELYSEKRFKNMSVILNGTDSVNSRYYSYGNYENHTQNN